MDNAALQPDMAFRVKIGSLLLLTGIFLFNFLSRIVFGPLMPAIEEEMGFGHARAGSLFLMITAGYFVSLALSGVVNSRISHRKTLMLAASSVGGAMLLVSLGSSLVRMQWTMVVLGLGAGLYAPSAMATITSLVSRKNWGKALAIHEMAPNFSFLLAPLLAEVFLRTASWQTLAAVLGVLSIAAGAVFALFGQGGRFKGEAPNPVALGTLLKNPSIWILMALFAIGVGGTIGVFNMLPLYLVNEHGLDRGWANNLLSISRVSGLFMAFAAGWLSDRIGEKKTIMAVLAASGSFTLMLGLVSGTSLVALVILQAAVASCFFPAGFAALSRISTPAQRSVAVSCVIPLSFMVGGGAIPAFIGYMGETQSFSTGLLVVGALFFTGPLLTTRLTFIDKGN